MDFHDLTIAVVGGGYGAAPLFLLAGLFIGGGGTFYLSYRRLMRDGDRK